MRAAIAFAPLALFASSCGGKTNPVERTLAQKSEHVELHGTVKAAGKTQTFNASGDFTNHPDQGEMTMQLGGQTIHEVVTAAKVYIQSTALKLPKGKEWLVVDAAEDKAGTQTPTHMLRHGGYPMRVKDGLVTHIDLTTSTVTMSVDLSDFGESVHIHVPAAATTMRKDSL
jgi:hypothetical protein